MGRKGKLPELVLTEYEKTRLVEISRRRKSAQGLAKRARIVLECANGLSNLEVARIVGVSNQTVGTWRTRFIEHRLAGLEDLPRSGAPRRHDDDKIEEIVSKTLESTPPNATHWSVRTMAKEAGVSRDTVSRVWKAFGLQPHRSKVFRLSTDPFFIEKVRDVVGLYMSPPENALVLCVDEKSQIQALERSQPILPMQQGIVERHSHDYYRHGTTTLFAALDIKTGEVFGKCQSAHTHKEFLSFLRKIEREVPSELEIHAVLDNYGTHKTPAVERWLAQHPRWHLHFIPTHSSWLNQVERWFAKITNDMIRRGVFRSVRQLEDEIENYIEANNENPKPFKWTADADTILGKVARICEKLT